MLETFYPKVRIITTWRGELIVQFFHKIYTKELLYALCNR